MTNELGNRIRARRKVMGLSLRQLGKHAGVSHLAIHRIETGSTADPRFSSVSRVARVLKLDLDELAALL